MGPPLNGWPKMLLLQLSTRSSGERGAEKRPCKARNKVFVHFIASHKLPEFVDALQCLLDFPALIPPPHLARWFHSPHCEKQGSAAVFEHLLPALMVSGRNTLKCLFVNCERGQLASKVPKQQKELILKPQDCNLKCSSFLSVFNASNWWPLLSYLHVELSLSVHNRCTKMLLSTLILTDESLTPYHLTLDTFDDVQHTTFPQNRHMATPKHEMLYIKFLQPWQTHQYQQHLL